MRAGGGGASEALGLVHVLHVRAPALHRGHAPPGVVTTLRGACGTPKAGTRSQHARYVAPWRQAALRLWYTPREAGTRAVCVPYGGPGAYASAQRAT